MADVPNLKSRMVLVLPYVQGTPFLVSWARIMPLSTSVLWVTRVPARVVDEVPPESAMGSTKTPKPDLAEFIIMLQELSGRVSGVTQFCYCTW